MCDEVVQAFANHVTTLAHAKTIAPREERTNLRFSLRFLFRNATLCVSIFGKPFSGGAMEHSTERRASRRFTMTLPLTVRSMDPSGNERRGQTRDVSFRGLYFLIEADFAPGSQIEFILTLPREITMAGDVHIRCFAEIVRVEPHSDRRGIAARIDRYEFLPSAA